MLAQFYSWLLLIRHIWTQSSTLPNLQVSPHKICLWCRRRLVWLALESAKICDSWSIKCYFSSLQVPQDSRMYAAIQWWSRWQCECPDHCYDNIMTRFGLVYYSTSLFSSLFLLLFHLWWSLPTPLSQKNYIVVACQPSSFRRSPWFSFSRHLQSQKASD